MPLRIEKVAENIENELNRVIIHGVLHYMGFKDKNPADKDVMTAEEDKCLALLNA